MCVNGTAGTVGQVADTVVLACIHTISGSVAYVCVCVVQDPMVRYWAEPDLSKVIHSLANSFTKSECPL